MPIAGNRQFAYDRIMNVDTTDANVTFIAAAIDESHQSHQLPWSDAPVAGQRQKPN
jgi:hypothetical protein